MYIRTTQEVQVTVEPIFLEDQSTPDKGHFVWAYRVWIENKGNETVQLISRRWLITDVYGFTQEILGEGVIGEQPIISPNEVYHYTSGTSLTSASGIMQGAYQMRTTKNKKIEIDVPAFSLDSPYEIAAVN